METSGTTMEELRTMQAIQSINQKIPDVELRDLFAMSAINGLALSSRLALSSKSEPFAADYAKRAYIIADAMLVARKGK